jgi:hypothetical protein
VISNVEECALGCKGGVWDAQMKKRQNI